MLVKPLMIWHLLQLNQILDLDVVIRTVKQISSPVKSSWISGAALALIVSSPEKSSVAVVVPLVLI